MVKNLSYREKLLELSRIYKISEIQNYIKRKKKPNYFTDRAYFKKRIKFQYQKISM